MKRGITIERDYHDDSWVIEKKKGVLTFDEIRDALREADNCGRFVTMIDLESEWNDNGYYLGMGEGDSAKAYSLDAIQAMYDPDRRHGGCWWEHSEDHTLTCSMCKTAYKTDALTLVHRKGKTVWDYEMPCYCPACGARMR